MLSGVRDVLLDCIDENLAALLFVIIISLIEKLLCKLSWTIALLPVVGFSRFAPVL